MPAARSSRRSTARLRGFQRLEDRLCLSVTAVLEAGILSIVGSADDDRVELIADGAGNVTVRTDDPGAPSQVFQGVEGVSVDLLGGNDTFTFRGRGETLPSLIVRLGEGNDTARVEMTGALDVDLDIAAGEGDDDVGIGLLLPAVQKVREAAARMSVDLGDGADQFRLGAVGYPQVELGLTVGEGDDDVGIALLLPAVQKVRDAAARINVDLGGGANSVRVRAIGYESVDLAFASWDGDDHVRF